MRQEAVIRVAGGDSEPGTIGRGVRQGCPISPLLFSVYAEAMMIEALGDVMRNDANKDEGDKEIGVRIGGQIIEDVRFADDQGMLASTEEGLQRTMNRLNDTVKKFDMKINVQKTKVMIVSRKGEKFAYITIEANGTSFKFQIFRISHF